MRSVAPKVLMYAAALAALLLLPGVSRAQEKSAARIGAEERPWTIEAGRLVHDKKRDVYEASDGVIISSGDKYIQSEKIIYNIKTQIIELPGDFVFSYGRDYISGKSARIDLKDETGWIKEGLVFIKENNLTVRGKSLEKTGPFSFKAEDAEFTTCDIEDPDWSVSCGKVDVTYEGYGLAKSVVFKAKGLPVAYTPILPFPAKKKRQTGFLIPGLGHTTLGGYDVDLPLYYAPSEDFDATVYTHYMSERGVMEGLEARYFATPRTKGYWRFDYLDDHLSPKERIDAGFRAEKDNRWWLKAKNDFNLPGDIEGRLDLDLVSDRDYLGEFKTGFSSFTKIEKNVEKFMNRGFINDENSLIRESTLGLSRVFSTVMVTGELHYLQDLELSRDETTLSQLPKIEISGIKQKLFETPVYLEGESSYTHFYRREGAHGHRVDIYPRFSLPFRVGYLDLEPSAGLRETAYYLDGYDEPAGSDIRDRRTHTREIYDLAAEGSTRLSRIFEPKLLGVEKMRHELKPFVRAEYVPYVNQRKNPYFDEEDRMERQTTLTYGITNNVTAKYREEPTGDYSYFDLLRLTVENTYDFNEAERNSEMWRTKTSFSDVRLLAEVNFPRYLEVEYEAAFSPYEYRVTKNELLFNIMDRRGDSLKLDYRYLSRTEQDKFEDRRLDPGQLPVSNSNEEVSALLTIALTPFFFVDLEKDYSISEGQSLKTGAALRYKAKCWSVTFGYEDEPGDMRFMFTFTLEGLGGL